MSKKLEQDQEQAADTPKADDEGQRSTTVQEVVNLAEEAVQKKFRPLEKTARNLEATKQEMDGMGGEVKQVEIPGEESKEGASSSTVMGAATNIAEKAADLVTSNPVTRELGELADKVDEVDNLSGEVNLDEKADK